MLQTKVMLYLHYIWCYWQTVKYSDCVALRPCDTVTVRGIVVPWLGGTVTVCGTVWYRGCVYCDCVVLWYCDRVVLWLCGTVAVCTVAVWYYWLCAVVLCGTVTVSDVLDCASTYASNTLHYSTYTCMWHRLIEHIQQGGGYVGDELSEEMLRREPDQVTDDMGEMTLNGNVMFYSLMYIMI